MEPEENGVTKGDHVTRNNDLILTGKAEFVWERRASERGRSGQVNPTQANSTCLHLRETPSVVLIAVNDLSSIGVVGIVFLCHAPAQS